MSRTWKDAKLELTGRGQAISLVTAQKELKIQEAWAQRQSTQDLLDLMVNFATSNVGWKPQHRIVIAKELRNRFTEVMKAEQTFQSDLKDFKSDAERSSLRIFRQTVLARLKLGS